MRTALCLFVAVLAMVSAAPSLAQLSGTPTVIDGDTIEIAGRRIHLYGIDAPELGQTCRLKTRTYRCGVLARDALTDLTVRTRVRCRSRGIEGDGEMVASCIAGDYDISEGMVHTGWALPAKGAPGRCRKVGGARERGGTGSLARHLRRALGLAGEARFEGPIAGRGGHGLYFVPKGI